MVSRLDQGISLTYPHAADIDRFMSRPWRIEFSGTLYHVLSRGNEQGNLFGLSIYSSVSKRAGIVRKSSVTTKHSRMSLTGLMP
jgi:hypothetical protein